MVPPTLNPSREALEPIFGRLVAPYVDYCTTVSTRSMAMSIESCTYLWHVCAYFSADRVCDLGSGFTSYTLGAWAQASPRQIEVVSVDTDETWLHRTEAFCRANGVTANRYMMWDDWKASDARYDVIVHDMASGDLRNEAMVAVMRRTDKAALFDDMGHTEHSAQMLAVCDTFGFSPLDVKELTLDQVNRFARLAVR